MTLKASPLGNLKIYCYPVNTSNLSNIKKLKLYKPPLNFILRRKGREVFSRDCIGVTPDGALPLFIGGGDQLCW